MSAPRLTVQIVTWNHASVIDSCLESLSLQSCGDFELLVLDNASTDGSADKIACWLDLERSRRGAEFRAELVRAAANHGFTGGNNQLYARARGEWILFLNPDVVLPVDFVAKALRLLAMQPADVGTVAPLLVRPDGTVDSTGLLIDRFRRVYDRGRDEASASAYQQEEDVAGCSGAVALHRRAMLSDVCVDGQPLDDLLFAYYDDLDLSWRARLRGWRCRYLPQLSATHRRAGRNALRRMPGREARGERGAREQTLVVRNRFLVMVKCERGLNLVKSLPWLIPFELARLVFLTVRAPRALAAYPQALAALPAALRARRQIQRRSRTHPAVLVGLA